MREYIVIRKLVNEGKFEEAIKKAKEMEDEEEKLMTLCMIAEAMVYEGRKEEALLLLKEAFKIAEEMENGFAQSLFMSKIAFGIAIAGKVEEALKIASNIKVSSEKVYTMVRISDLLMDRGEIEGAKKILEEAERITEEMHDDILKVISIKSVAYAFVDIGEVEKAWNLMEHAKNMAEKFDEEASIAFALIAQFMTELGKLNEAMELIEKIRYNKAWLLSDIAYMKKDVDLLQKAFKIAREMESRYEKVSVMSNVASIMAEWGRKQEANKLINECIKISEEIECEMEKAMALAVISHAMFDNGDERYTSMLNKSMEIAKELESYEKEDASSSIAHVLIEIGKFNDAMNFINGIREEEIKAAVYLSIANDLINEGKKEEAMKIAEFMNDKILKGRIKLRET